MQWDAWGQPHRPASSVSPLWREAQAHRRRAWASSPPPTSARTAQHSRVAPVRARATSSTPSLDVYSCPLAMTDGAAARCSPSATSALIERALPRLTARDPTRAWTSGQWMTERTGGSDVAAHARPSRSPTPTATAGSTGRSGSPRRRRRRWRSRSRGRRATRRAAAGSRSSTSRSRDADGAPNGILVNRLKDKLGTRMVPTAELDARRHAARRRSRALERRRQAHHPDAQRSRARGTR